MLLPDVAREVPEAMGLAPGGRREENTEERGEASGALFKGFPGGHEAANKMQESSSIRSAL